MATVSDLASHLLQPYFSTRLPRGPSHPYGPRCGSAQLASVSSLDQGSLGSFPTSGTFRDDPSKMGALHGWSSIALIRLHDKIQAA